MWLVVLLKTHKQDWKNPHLLLMCAVSDHKQLWILRSAQQTLWRPLQYYMQIRYNCENKLFLPINMYEAGQTGSEEDMNCWAGWCSSLRLLDDGRLFSGAWFAASFLILMCVCVFCNCTCCRLLACLYLILLRCFQGCIWLLDGAKMVVWVRDCPETRISLIWTCALAEQIQREGNTRRIRSTKTVPLQLGSMFPPLCTLWITQSANERFHSLICLVALVVKIHELMGLQGTLG